MAHPLEECRDRPRGLVPHQPAGAARQKVDADSDARKSGRTVRRSQASPSRVFARDRRASVRAGESEKYFATRCNEEKARYPESHIRFFAAMRLDPTRLSACL